MFGKVHHVSYLVADLSATIDDYVKLFQGEFTGRGRVAGLGEVGFVQAGGVEVEFIEPDDRSQLQPGSGHLFHHGLAERTEWGQGPLAYLEIADPGCRNADHRTLRRLQDHE